jgi:hypothetical protein
MIKSVAINFDIIDKAIERTISFNTCRTKCQHFSRTFDNIDILLTDFANMPINVNREVLSVKCTCDHVPLAIYIVWIVRYRLICSTIDLERSTACSTQEQGFICFEALFCNDRSICINTFTLDPGTYSNAIYIEIVKVFGSRNLNVLSIIVKYYSTINTIFICNICWIDNNRNSTI